MKIYLAGPDVFRENAVEHLDGLKNLCKKYGFEGLAPLDNVIEIPDEDKLTPKHSNLIFKANYELIKKCDIIIANIEPFRGACIDDGTAWEIGCGFAYGKRMYGYTCYNDSTLVGVTQHMWDMEDHNFEGGTNVEYTEVENFGNCVNLMICDSIKESGGVMLKTFEDCLAKLRDDIFGINLPVVKDGEYQLSKDEEVLTAKSGKRYIVYTGPKKLNKHDLVFDRECSNVPKGYWGELGHIQSFSTEGFITIKLIDGSVSISDWCYIPLKEIKN
jgi:nucleoside 2-deoxyribosyltransferase